MDSGLSVPANSWQLLTLSVDLPDQKAELQVGGSMDLLPLFTCPSAIGSAQFGSYAMGSGMGIVVLGSGMIDNVSITTSSGSSFDAGIPEPTTIAVMTAGGFLAVLAWAAGVMRRRG